MATSWKVPYVKYSTMAIIFTCLYTADLRHHGRDVRIRGDLLC
jgi:hypothetical protein